jgi:uncharacterized protein Veg
LQKKILQVAPFYFYIVVIYTEYSGNSIYGRGEFMTQLDLNRVRQSIKNQIGSKIKISANRGRHKFVIAKGVITQTYPNIFLVELENTDGNDQNKTVSFSYQDVITRDVRMMLLEN